VDTKEGTTVTSSTETGEVTGTKDKDYNLIWYIDACLSNALRMETYIRDAEREEDTELTELFRKAQADSRKGAELDDQFQGMPAEGVGWAAAEATARRSGGGLPALVVEVAAGGQASGSTSGCVNRTGLPSDRA
jgi:hypothetical protein